jgi:hypothetical protein
MTDKPTINLRVADDDDQIFFETLRGAAFIFEKELHGRFKGSALACRAVAHYIYKRGGGAELAGPFTQIAAAFDELEKGGKPRLFSKKTDREKERERSPDRKHYHVLASTFLDVLIKLGDGLNVAADNVARHVNAWPGMKAQTVTGNTVIAWRKGLLRATGAHRQSFDTMVQQTLKESNPRQIVDAWLQRGPPGAFKS